MTVLGWILRIALAAVMAAAALGKLADRPGARAAARAFGAPRRMAAAAGLALPAIELATAGLLLVPATARTGALTALGLLALLTAVVLASLARGRRPDCRCFGALRSAPIGAATVARNAVLIAAAGAVLAIDAYAWPSALAPGSVAVGFGLGAAVAAPLAAVLLRRHGQALLRADILAAELSVRGIAVDGAVGPEGHAVVGRPAPEAVIAQRTAAGKPLLAVFIADGCEPCAALAPRLATWRAEHAAVLDVAELDLAAHEESAAACGVTGSPGAVVVSAGGRIARPPAHGPASIEALLTAAVDELRAVSKPVAERLPDAVVADATGEPVSLRERLADDRDTLVLFWSPGCGFCRSMRAAVDGLAADPAGPAVLVVSSAAIDPAAEDERLLAEVLIDARGTVGRTVGAHGTPMAVLARPGGDLHGPLATGADAIVALARPAALEIVHVGTRDAR